MKSLQFFNLPNPSSRTMAQGFTQPRTKMSTRRIFWGKARSARKAGNLIVIFEPIVGASTACYTGISLLLFLNLRLAPQLISSPLVLD
jgi:hypothetical protein